MTAKPATKPVSWLDLSAAYAIDTARSLNRILFKNIKRTHDVVDSEYNVGQWGRVLAEKAWLRERTAEDFLVGHNHTERLAKVDGGIVRLSTSDYYRYRLGALAELVSRHASDAVSLVELGAGFGYNLFCLSRDPHWVKLRGLDIAPNAIEAGRQIASHFKVADRVSFDRIDLTNAEDPHFAELHDETLLTYFCIEQIPYAVDAVLENIIRARPRRVINIEPATSMLNRLDPRDIASRVYIRSMDYQTRLFGLLDELDAKGRIRVIARERMNFAPTLHNDGLLYVWEPLENLVGAR
ncbi:class I SAM-dependent methyltransferase [Bradyrhizobium sp. UFLA05-112]